jgi:hypothetical protein
VNFVAGSSPVVAANVGTMLYYTGSGTLAWDPDGTGATGQVLIARLPVGTALSGADLLFV